MPENKSYIVRAPLFPLYSHVKYCIRAWDGETVQSVREMTKAIFDKTGTPQNPVDWSNPDEWIAMRLSGDDARLASKIWKGSNKTVNPRHVYGCYLLINRLDLLDQAGGTFRLHARANLFLADDPATLIEIDASEGIPVILSLLTETTQAKRADLVAEWGDYLQLVSKFSTPITFNETLSRRLLNLVARGLVERDGNRYSISENGIAYLGTFPETPADGKGPSGRTAVAMAARAFNNEQRVALKKRLMALHPYAFEHFVRELLEAMDYENVEVTKQSNDKGVDVVANFQFGITEITEVVQVKRTERTIGRPEIDKLRGALPYHNAIRGTIITLGKFAGKVGDAALYKGAAPISLIDGERLIELVVKHEVGIKRKPLDLLEIDEVFFEQREPEVEENEDLEQG